MTELETMQRAKLYLDKLAQGIDPITDTELPYDSALNNIRLARCFFYVSGVLQQVIDNGGTTSTKPKKVPFCLTSPQIASLHPDKYSMTISDFCEYLYGYVEVPNMSKPSTTAFTNWLLEKGFMEKITLADGKQRRVPTENGMQIGMYTETRQGQYGEYQTVFYSPAAQQFLIDNLSAVYPST